MDGVRQRRYVADADVSEVARREDEDASLLTSQKLEDDSLSSESSKHSTKDPTALPGVEKDGNKKSSISARGVEQLAGEGKRRLEESSDEETLWDIGLEVFLPFVVAGLGMATTGITLNYVKVSTIMPFRTHFIYCLFVKNKNGGGSRKFLRGMC